MGKKVFVSYKYGDTQVYRLPSTPSWQSTRVRDYVDILQNQLGKQGDHLYKGEDDGESLEDFKDEAIQSKLSDKIYDTSVTIVLVSKGMNQLWSPEKEQWIPWEISYSLRNKTRNGKPSKTNAVIAVKLPDETNSYDYDPHLFEIIKNNRNNLLHEYPSDYSQEHLQSYIFITNWNLFITNIDNYINLSIELWKNRNNYTITTSI